MPTRLVVVWGRAWRAAARAQAQGGGPGGSPSSTSATTFTILYGAAHQVATTILATSEIAWPIRRPYSGSRFDVTTLPGRCTGVDKEGRRVPAR